MSSIVSFKSGKVVVSTARRGFTPSGPAGVPGGDGMSTQVSCRILSSAGSLLVNASYQRVASFLYLFIFVFLSVSIVSVRVHEHRIRPSKVNKYFSIVLLSDLRNRELIRFMPPNETELSHHWRRRALLDS